MERGRKGIGGCLQAATSVDNITNYAGIGTGLILGNVLAKEMDKWYSGTLADQANPTSAEKFVQYVARSAGRLVTSAALCTASGGTSKGTKDFLQGAAVGSSGMILVDAVKTYGGDTLGGYADLGRSSMGRRVSMGRRGSLQRAGVSNMPASAPTRIVSNRTNSLQVRNRAIMESGGLGGMNGRETNSLQCKKPTEPVVTMRL